MEKSNIPIKRYIRPALKVETFKVFKQRHLQMNSDLKDMGVKHGVPFTRFMDLVAKKSRVGDEHVFNMLKNKRKQNG
jgi:hypothetical protein